jgi:hypothetical protein
MRGGLEAGVAVEDAERSNNRRVGQSASFNYKASLGHGRVDVWSILLSFEK